MQRMTIFLPPPFQPLYDIRQEKCSYTELHRTKLILNHDLANNVLYKKIYQRTHRKTFYLIQDTKCKKVHLFLTILEAYCYYVTRCNVLH
jgi:hypothetical protein